MRRYGRCRCVWKAFIRLSIPSEQLPRALLFQVFYRVCSEQLQIEEPDYSPLFRCSVGLNMATRSRDRTTFGENRDQLPTGEVAATFFNAISCQVRAAGLPSDEYCSVDRHSLGSR